MRYHYKNSDICFGIYGEKYSCNHAAYSVCTLYSESNKGLAVIQQRFDPSTKCTFWTDIDIDLRDAIYLNPNFLEYFARHSAPSVNGIYPTVTVRQIMWGLRMKPIKKEAWETVFDHCPI